MSEKKWYKGKYTINPAENGEYPAMEIRIDAYHVEYIASVFAIDENDKIAIATANLFAASPDLYDALEHIIELNRQTAIHQYGDAEKSNNWACVIIAREALRIAREGRGCK